MAKLRARVTAKPKAAPKLTNEQRLLLEQLRGKGYAALPEVRFHPARKFRIDVAVSSSPYRVDVSAEQWHVNGRAIAIEIDGGIFMKRARHSGGLGQLRDMEKLNLLTECGWRVLRFTPQQVRDGSALAQIERCL